MFLVLAHDRRRILHFNVTPHPTAQWTGQQLRNAFPFEQFPRYLLRDRDAIFGQDFRGQMRDMGPVSGYLERRLIVCLISHPLGPDKERQWRLMLQMSWLVVCHLTRRSR